MNNDIELPDPDLTALDPSIATDAKIGKEGKIILIIIAAVCVLICLCSMVCIGIGAFGIGNVVKENAPIKAVLNDFMQNMAANDIESAYALFAPDSQERTTLDDLRNMRSGTNVVMFQGYEEVRINGINLQSGINNGDGPQGTTAAISGKILYANGKKGEFEATLEKVNGEWMLYSIDLWLGASDSKMEDVSF
jgi:hypothetical protein